MVKAMPLSTTPTKAALALPSLDPRCPSEPRTVPASHPPLFKPNTSRQKRGLVGRFWWSVKLQVANGRLFKIVFLSSVIAYVCLVRLLDFTDSQCFTP